MIKDYAALSNRLISEYAVGKETIKADMRDIVRLLTIIEDYHFILCENLAARPQEQLSTIKAGVIFNDFFVKKYLQLAELRNVERRCWATYENRKDTEHAAGDYESYEQAKKERVALQDYIKHQEAKI